MNILVGIDDTIAITSPTWRIRTEQWMYQNRYTRIRPKSKDVYDLALSYNVPEEKRKRCYSEIIEDFPFLSLPHVMGAQRFIDSLSADNLSFITARPQSTDSLTARWLEHEFQLRFPIIYYSPLALEALPDVLIDNSEERCQYFASKGVQTILFTGIQVAKSEVTVDLLGTKVVSTLAEASKIIEQERKEYV